MLKIEATIYINYLKLKAKVHSTDSHSKLPVFGKERYAVCAKLLTMVYRIITINTYHEFKTKPIVHNLLRTVRSYGVGENSITHGT